MQFASFNRRNVHAALLAFTWYLVIATWATGHPPTKTDMVGWQVWMIVLGLATSAVPVASYYAATRISSNPTWLVAFAMAFLVMMLFFFRSQETTVLVPIGAMAVGTVVGCLCWRPQRSELEARIAHLHRHDPHLS